MLLCIQYWKYEPGGQKPMQLRAISGGFHPFDWNTLVGSLCRNEEA